MPQAFRFLLVGASNTCVSFLVFGAVVRTLPATPSMAGLSQAVSYSCGILWSYMLNNAWVFNGPRTSQHAFFRFLASQLALMLISAGAVAGASRFIPLRAEYIWVIVMGAITALNFTVLRKWVFKA